MLHAGSMITSPAEAGPLRRAITGLKPCASTEKRTRGLKPARDKKQDPFGTTESRALTQNKAKESFFTACEVVP